MIYKIKQLAEMSSVSTKTLRYYDKIGLLKPAYCAKNGYRFYTNDQLLMLQQILFFREIGFKLKDIGEVINSTEFDKISALKIHKKNIIKSILKSRALIETIDKTIGYLNSEITLKENELYMGFEHEQQKSMVTYLSRKMGENANNIIEQCKNNVKELNANDLNVMQEETGIWCQAFRDAIRAGLLPDSVQVQALVDQYYQLRVKRFCNASKDDFIGMIKAEISHPEYEKQYALVHKDFASYFLKSVITYANNNL
ncbi:mercury resistance transcriptional regulator SkgA [Legionella geestiana]|uniref:Mercury resistance transcriptional regulator SkgA n=1 Tax=Legionella geestiana TaxID=45065 RepID=A0A0W0U7J2_9GAMM|nr:MerR family transcriptional regulator [Legionella geestiana]KTD04003.1 mercury resistance transcriptional regulator SkgA [Legionella geestiana]QBS12861.1 MerR family transcriptional regulator [Legionella geestiana]STX54653.1 transcriptional regulator SkgA, mercury resistanc [Legionella geestiana]